MAWDRPPLTASAVCERAGISHRNLDYWLRSGVIGLADRCNIGSGFRRLFSEDESEAICRTADEKRDLDRRIKAWSSGEYWRSLTEQRVA